MTKKYMTVNQLKRILDKFEGDLPVILQSDPEGNGYMRLDGASDNAAVKSVLYFMEDVKVYKMTDDLKKVGFTESDLAPESYHQVVVLFP